VFALAFGLPPLILIGRGGQKMFTNLAMNLADETLKDIQRLEKEIGCPILAFSFHDLEPAELDEEKIQRIREYEKGTCISLLAVKP
jgi:hypothetical protein